MATAIVPTEDRLRLLGYDEIYTGPTGTGQYVPNVDDIVFSWDTGFWRVVAVDTGNTNLSMLSRVNIASLGGGLSDVDSTIVAGVGANDNAFCAYVNNSVVPHELTLDTRNIWNGSDNAYVKVFRGTDISAATGTVISAMLDTKGKIVSENIPLENVVVPNATNLTQKTAKTAYASATLETGESVMVVTYTGSGVVTSIDKFVVVETNFVRSLNQAAKYVSDIQIVSPFLSTSDKRLINCPINMAT